MAKKKAKAVSTKKKAAAPVIPPPKVAEPVKKPNGLVGFLLAAVLLVVVAEVYFITVTSIRQSKRPLYVNSWAHQYKGLTSVGEYGNFLYGIDNTRGDVYKTDKNTGVLEKILSFSEGVNSAVADSKDDIFILTKDNQIFKVDGRTYKTVKKFKIGDMKEISWMEIDSKDNLFFSSPSSGLVAKYDPDFKKLLQFGGPSEDKGGISSAAKIFAGPKDDMYVMDAYKPGEIAIKIFDDNGKFIRSWPVKKIKKFDSLTNMAVAADGNVYINSYDESKIYVFGPAGKFLGSFDGDKDKRFQIIYAASITGGKSGLIYVVTHQLVVFKTINY
jgi:sugar lactone lactonase YvrE